MVSRFVTALKSFSFSKINHVEPEVVRFSTTTLFPTLSEELRDTSKNDNS
jgi:hypothetical protein